MKHKPGWDRQRESAKLLDFESPVDARRCVCVCACMSIIEEYKSMDLV